MATKYASFPLSFEANDGQADTSTKYIAHGKGYSLSLTETGAQIALNGARLHPKPEAHNKQTNMPATVINMTLAGANRHAQVLGKAKLPGTVSYFRGPGMSATVEHVDPFERVQYYDIYPGTDMVYYGNQGQLEYDFIVKPGADPHRINMAFTGADAVTINDAGGLTLFTGGGNLEQHKPVIYQNIDGVRHSIAGRYVKCGAHNVTFSIGEYDHSAPLIIDPILSYSSFVGGSAWDEGHAIAVDKDGNAWITGATYVNGDRDILVAKLNAAGTAVLWSGIFGGPDRDDGNAIAVDAAGNAYVTGSFTAPDAMFPDIYDDQQLFVLKIDSTGNVIYSYAQSGSGEDNGYAIAVDNLGYTYVAGSASGGHAVGFPIVNGLSTYGGFGDGIVMVLDPNGQNIVYSTYLGGPNLDAARGIALDPKGFIYVTGNTGGGFPITNGAYQKQYGGDVGDVFVTKINPTKVGMASIVYSTYIGSDDYDGGSAIAVDDTGCAYITGSTNATGFSVPYPTTAGSFQPGWGGGNCNPGGNFYPCADAVVSKLNAAGSALVYSTYLGGVGTDYGSGIVVDGNHNAVVTGYCLGFFPVVNSLQNYGGGSDAFVTKFNAAGTGVTYSTFLGGSGDEHSIGIARDIKGAIYVAGYTASADYPTTPGAFHTAYSGNNDPFVTKISEPPAPSVASVTLAPATVGSGSFSTGTITMSGPVTAATTITLTSANTAAATLPAAAIVSAGASSATFTVTAKSVAANTVVTISAAGGGVTKTANLTITPPTLTAFAMAPAVVPGGASSVGTVFFSVPVAAATTVTLASGNAAAAQIPASIIVPAGSASATFSVTTKKVAVLTSVTLKATYGAISKTATLVVQPPAATLAGVVVSPVSVLGGATINGKVTLTGAAATATAVTLTSSSVSAPVPASVTIPAGASSATFTIATKPVAANITATIKAASGGITKTAALIIQAPALTSLIVSPVSVVGGKGVTGKVTLSGPAAVATTVKLTSSNTSVAVPVSVVIAAGAVNATFTVSTKVVSANATATISGVYAGVTKTAMLTVTH